MVMKFIFESMIAIGLLSAGISIILLLISVINLREELKKLKSEISLLKRKLE